MAFNLPLPGMLETTIPANMARLNALTDQNLSNQIKSSEAKYAPYTTYANAMSKLAYTNMLPYQIKATMMSNPMLWMAMKDNPQAMQSMMDSFTKSIPQGNAITGNIQVPAPNQMGNGNSLLSMLIDKITGGNKSSPTNAMQQPQLPAPSQPGNAVMRSPGENMSVGSPLVPATQGGSMGAIAGKETAPYVRSPHPASALIQDPNDPTNTISVPSNEFIANAQKTINASERVKPLLKQLSSAAKPFLTAGGLANTAKEGFENFFLGGKNESPSLYANYKALLEKSPEALLNSYNLRPTVGTLSRMQKVIKPIYGENADYYEQRILNELESIQKEQIGTTSENLHGGFSRKKNEVTKNKVEQKLSPGSKMLAKDMELPSFSSKKEFQSWYANQNETVQNAVKSQLGKK